MTILPISNVVSVDATTHKLRTLVEAIDLGYNIPQAYVVIPPVDNDSTFFDSLEDCDWLIRPSVKESKIGTRGGICRKEDIRLILEDVFSHHEVGAQVILQKYIQSDRAGIMMSSHDVYIETVCGANYGLTRAGIEPSIYSLKDGVRNATVVLQPTKYIMDRAKYVEVSCNEESSLSDELFDSLIEMATDFRSKIVEWCSQGDTTYFLEYWNLSDLRKMEVQGKISFVASQTGDIVVLPNADIKYTARVLHCNGVIAKVGGYLSHLGIICLEMGVPFVVSNEEFREGEMVFLDAESRRVIRLKDRIGLEN